MRARCRLAAPARRAFHTALQAAGARARTTGSELFRIPHAISEHIVQWARLLPAVTFLRTVTGANAFPTAGGVLCLQGRIHGSA
jgi:hypothetical protein